MGGKSGVEVVADKAERGGRTLPKKAGGVLRKKVGSGDGGEEAICLPVKADRRRQDWTGKKERY